MPVIRDQFYPVKVWITTMVSGTTVFMLFDFFLWRGDDNLDDFFYILKNLLLANLIIGLPGLVVFYSVFKTLNEKDMPINRMKERLILIGFGLFLFTWVAFNTLIGRYVFFHARSLFLYLDFLICIIISCRLFGKSKNGGPAFLDETGQP